MRGTTVAFISVALFSLYAVFGKMLIGTLSPLFILLLNHAIAGIVLFLVIDLLRKVREMRSLTGKDLKFLFTISVFSSVVSPLLFLIGLGLTSVANTMLIARSESVLLSIFAVFVFGNRITRHQVLGAIVMFAGIFVIVTNNFTVGLNLNLGDILIFGSAVSYATGTMLFKKFVSHLHPEIIVTIRNLFGALILFAFSLFMVDFAAVFPLITPAIVLPLLGLVFLSTILAQILWYKSLEMTSVANISVATLATPLITILYAVVLLGETIISSQLIGGALIMAGLVILEVHFKKVHTPKMHELYLKLKHMHHG